MDVFLGQSIVGPWNFNGCSTDVPWTVRGPYEENTMTLEFDPLWTVVTGCPLPI